MFKRDQDQSALTNIAMGTASHDGDQAIHGPYTQPALYELGSLEKVQAYIMDGYPDGWRGYYSRS